MTVDTTLRDARAVFEDGVLKLSNAMIERWWRWTGTGFVTVRLASLETGTVWTREESGVESDWLVPGYDRSLNGELTAVSAKVSDDEGFTSEHIEAAAEISYPEADVSLRFTAWIYPGVPGVRTQLSVKGGASYDAAAGDAVLPSHHRADFMPIAFGSLRRRMFGYYNETQQRNDPCEDILKEETVEHSLKNREFHTWPSVLCLENDAEGMAVVKESHKCPNQPGYDCGLFVCDSDEGLAVHGWGVSAREIDETWRSAWASWCIVYAGGSRKREAAFKSFDGARYPLDESRDIYVQANTWGSGANNGPGGSGSRGAAIEEEVLKELESCADLGIDVLQIDDGWQVPPSHNKWMPDEENGWYPHPESYPSGWGPVKERARELGVRLGLWAAAQPVTLEELKDNYRDGGFLTYKLDFASLNGNELIRALMHKVREFIKSTGHKVRVNWDVTEVCRRYGYFFAREYGCLFMSNRKPVIPASTTYRPETMLRDLWQLSRYINIRKVQASIQNVDMVNKALSNAYLHPNDYCVAVALMSTPLFFQQTMFYTEEARKQIRPLLAVYKKHQAAIFRGMVIPIGSRPDNYSWSGFQSHDSESGTGYLTIFRELNNESASEKIALEHAAGRSLTITDLMSGQSRTESIGQDGKLPLTIQSAPGYLFLRYE